MVIFHAEECLFNGITPLKNIPIFVLMFIAFVFGVFQQKLCHVFRLFLKKSQTIKSRGTNNYSDLGQCYLTARSNAESDNIDQDLKNSLLHA